MKNTSNLTSEERLSHINARLADTMELMQNSCAAIRQSYTIIAGIGSEIEEIYLSTGENQEKHEMPEST